MKPLTLTPDYGSFLVEVKGRIQSARLQAGRAVNRELVMLYWDIGRGIVERQKTLGWGEAVVERFAADLREEFPDMTSFSADNVWRMRQFYTEHSTPGFLEQAVQELQTGTGMAFLGQAVPEIGGNTENSILGQAVPEILAQTVRELVLRVPWGHHVQLMKKLKDPAARLYYLRATAQFGWSRSVLLNQIKGQAYERAVKEKKTHNFELALPEHFAEQADEMLKSRYNLEFLGIARPMKELELEERLISRLQQFILELGYGFCFVGRNGGRVFQPAARTKTRVGKPALLCRRGSVPLVSRQQNAILSQKWQVPDKSPVFMSRKSILRPILLLCPS